MRHLWKLAILGLAAAAAAGCAGVGGGSHKQGAAPHKVRPGQPMQQFSVKESEWKLDPSRITFDRAGVYRFQAVNVGHVAHALAIVSPAGVAVKTAWIKPGQSTTVDVVVSSHGNYRFFDPIHRHHAGMSGLAILG